MSVIWKFSFGFHTLTLGLPLGQQAQYSSILLPTNIIWDISVLLCSVYNVCVLINSVQFAKEPFTQCRVPQYKDLECLIDVCAHHSVYQLMDNLRFLRPF